nr:reverse transcriptase N-terminal domain-containing protein [Candidatus Contubernalis alkalaceticus]
MNFSNSTTDKTERLKDTNALTAQWESIEWMHVQKNVNRLQSRIAKATVKGDKNKVKRLQYLLTHSFYEKAYAVKKVTSNKGKNTSGVDKKLWSTSASKMKAVLTSTDKRYRTKPLRRVFIKKKGKNKKRPLGIPTMHDRAMQTLYALALEPVAEVTGDHISFGFRKGRSSNDACEQIFCVLARKCSPTWVLTAKDKLEK